MDDIMVVTQMNVCLGECFYRIAKSKCIAKLFAVKPKHLNVLNERTKKQQHKHKELSQSLLLINNSL